MNLAVWIVTLPLISSIISGLYATKENKPGLHYLSASMLALAAIFSVILFKNFVADKQVISHEILRL